MRKKKIIVSGAIAATIAISSVFGGCSLVSSNSAADMSQVIAEVTIAESAKLDKELADYSSAVGTSKILKRELVAYFLNAGYSYVQSGLGYDAVFNMLVNQLVETEVLTQYATMYLLNNKVKAGTHTLEEYKKRDGEVKKYEYLLDDEDIKIAKYSFLSALNSAIDSYEESILEDTSSSSGDATRTTPTGVDTEKKTYYPKLTDGDGNYLDDEGKVTTDETKAALDYNVYTGYEGYLLTQSGAYQNDALDGTRRATRLRAYNKFINSLASSSYDLVDKKNENLRDILSLKYIQDEYVSQLEQRIINKYYDLYEEAQEEKLLGDENYDYIQSKYDSMFDLQSESYVTESAFSSAISSLSDTSFALYAPTTEDIDVDGKYGFVYNILLPFSALQSVKLTALQALYADSNLDGGYKPEYYKARNSLLKNIYTTDQRSAWFNGTDEYAFKAADKGITDYYQPEGSDSGYLFFENNLVNTYRYETIEKYDGRYAYNGSVYKTDNDYILIPEKLDIDDMLDEFIGYINYASKLSVSKNPNSNYYNLSADNLYKDKNVKDKDKKIEYKNFIYASGKVNFKEDDAYNRANVLRSDKNNKSDQYKVLSAVNELQYAYTTDTGVLSNYLGYSVDAGSTKYIKEFECAAHEAINNGAGSWVVCAGDYGWHLIYVTYTFDNTVGEQFDPDWASNVKVEGTFENLFYEMIKTNDIADISTTRRTEIVTIFKTDDTVTTYQKRYQDLLDLGNE